MRVRIGVDIGGLGAIAFFVEGNLQKYYAMPQVEKRPDIQAFMAILLRHVTAEDDVHAVIEDLHSIFGTSAKSNFQFGWINGVVETALVALSIPYTKVMPKKWQKSIWEGVRPVEIISYEKKQKGISAEPKLNKDGTIKHKIDTKATSLLAAKRLFPEETFLATTRSSVPHDGIVDAVLIGEYCKRNF